MVLLINALPKDFLTQRRVFYLSFFSSLEAVLLTFHQLIANGVDDNLEVFSSLLSRWA